MEKFLDAYNFPRMSLAMEEIEMVIKVFLKIKTKKYRSLPISREITVLVISFPPFVTGDSVFYPFTGCYIG